MIHMANAVFLMITSESLLADILPFLGYNVNEPKKHFPESKAATFFKSTAFFLQLQCICGIIIL